MLKVVLVDDCKRELDELCRLVSGHLRARGLGFSVFSFTSAEEFMEGLSFPDADVKYDIYFLDVVMPGLDGIELGKRIRERDSGARIIYVSTSPDFAVKSFDVRAFYYVLKPLDKAQFSHVLELVLDDLAQDSLSTITVRTQGGARRIVRSDIRYVEHKDRRSCYVLPGGSVCSLKLTSSFLSANEELLGDARFFACGASLIVNLACISRIGRDGSVSLGLRGGREEVLHVPLRTVSSLSSAWMGYCLGKAR